MSSFGFLSGGGEMGARLRAIDWGATPFGPPGDWPAVLRSAMRLCLSSSFPTAIYWGPDLRVLYNDAWAPIPADKHPWALGRPAHEVWADIWPTVGPQFTQVIETGQGFAAYDQFLPMERGGQPRETWWTYAFTPLTDEQDRTLGILNQGHETTLKVLQDRARVDEVQRMRELFAQAPGAVALLAGPTHVFTMVNDAYSALAGNVRLLGLTVAEAMPEVVRQGFVDLLDGVFRTGLPYRGISTPVFLRGAKGELVEHSLDFVYQPILDAAGRTTDILVQISDQTGRDHALRQLRDADRRKDVFIATLAHELRNPLAPIRNGLQILKQANFSDARFERTRQMMERQLGHLVHLVDDLLDVSRITSGKVQLQYRRVPLADAVARAVESTHAAFEQNAQRLGVDVRDEALAVDGDPERLTQVFANLLSNAAKFTGEGGNVELSLFQEGSTAVLTVSDDGIGIPPESLEGIFEMFAQVQAPGLAPAGLGIGLALVSQLVQLHGGTVRAESEGLGRGSRFVVRLPLAAS